MCLQVPRTAFFFFFFLSSRSRMHEWTFCNGGKEEKMPRKSLTRHHHITAIKNPHRQDQRSAPPPV